MELAFYSMPSRVRLEFLHNNDMQQHDVYIFLTLSHTIWGMDWKNCLMLVGHCHVYFRLFFHHIFGVWPRQVLIVGTGLFINI